MNWGEIDKGRSLEAIEAKMRLRKDVCGCGHPRYEHFSMSREYANRTYWAHEMEENELGYGMCHACDMESREVRCLKFETFLNDISSIRNENNPSRSSQLSQELEVSLSDGRG